MATTNLWLRGARGKFAGSTLQKGTNGGTIARETVTPSNPNTDAQLWQRAIMATIMRAYSAGKEIFDHSFQGKSRGSECQQEFMKSNLKMLRAGFANDIDKSETNQIYTATAPGIESTTINPLIISKGTYAQNFLFGNYATDEDGKITNAYIQIPAVGSATTLAEYCANCGLIAGDLYTVVSFCIPYANLDSLYIQSSSGNNHGTNAIPQLSFNFFRYQVKASALTSTIAVAEATLGDILELTDASRSFPLQDDDWEWGDCSLDLTKTLAQAAIYAFFDHPYACYGVIRSRLDQDLRSTTHMLTSNKIYTTSTDAHAGLVADYVLEAWKAGTQSLGDSDKILEGGEG